MQWSLIKSWAKDKGYTTFREKINDQDNRYDYYWGKTDDPAITGMEPSVSKLAFAIFNHMTDYAHVDYQNKYKEQQARTDIDHDEFKEGW